jgi:hypothetical protein
VINEALLAEALGNLLGLFMFGFKGVDQVQANKVGHFDLDRHGAAVGSARVAHARLVARPTFDAVYVDDAGGRFHSSSLFNLGKIQSAYFLTYRFHY